MRGEAPPGQGVRPDRRRRRPPGARPRGRPDRLRHGRRAPGGSLCSRPGRSAATCRKTRPVVAVFRNQEAAFVRKAVAALRPAMLQFHGAEPPGFCASFGLPYIKALEAPAARGGGVAGGLAVAVVGGDAAGRPAEGAAAGRHDRRPRQGGRIVRDAGPPGRGAHPGERGRHCVAAARPAGVDVARGVESSPGRKDPALLRRFMSIVRDTRE